MRTSRLLIASALACAAAFPAAASADTASYDGTTVHVQGSDGNESITLSVDTPGYVTITTDQAGDGCTMTPASGVQCPLGPGGIDVQMGGGNDHVGSLSLSSGSLPDNVLRVDLGAGDDQFNGGDAAESVVGGPGNDELNGRAGDDKLDGGDGNDKLVGGAGRDELHGAGGDDLFDGDYFQGVSGDVIDGGPGNDKAEGWSDPSTDAPHPPISITMDGVANDGRPGEGDNVTSIERITSNVSGTIVTGDDADTIEMWANIDGGPSTIRTNGGNDVVTGGSRDETIDGGAGDDRLEGGFGNDVITGGPGKDVINADMSGSQCGVFQSCTVPFGNDTVDVRDGEADQVVCGPGTDTVTADAIDTIGPDCETVQRGAAAAPAGPGTTPAQGGGAKKAKGLSLTIGSVSRAALLKRGVTVSLAAPGAGRVSGRAVEGRKTVASGSAKAKRAGKIALRLKVSKAGRRALKRHGKHRLTVKVTFTPASGKSQTAAKTLTVR